LAALASTAESGGGAWPIAIIRRFEMADRVSASIEIGGQIAAEHYAELVEIAAGYALALQWGDEPFDGHRIALAASLELFAYEVPGGQFDELEAFCTAHGLAFVRWCDGYPGAWNAERVVFTGRGEPVSYAAIEDFVVIGRQTVESLGSYDAIIANFDAADFVVPPFVVAPFVDESAPALSI
jgi:hypothetical protein